MRLHRAGLLCAAVFFFSSGCGSEAGQPAGDATAKARADIAQARDAFWAAHERGDASAMASQLTEDAVLFAQGMGAVRGRTAIEESARQMFGQLRVTNFKILEQELDVHGEAAYELTTYSETLQPTGAAPSNVRGRYHIVWRRGEDGVWRVHRNLFNLEAAPGT